MVVLLSLLTVGALSLGLFGLHRRECALRAARDRNLARTRAAQARLAAFSAVS